jgi:glycosyltransferase involved in cell wall biosynthesis
MRILFLSTYATSGIETGGNVRLSSIVRTVQAAGHSSHVLAIVPPASVSASAGRHETVLPLSEGQFSRADVQADGYHDTLTGLRVMRDAEVLSQARAVARSFGPDIIFLEQPFLIEFAIGLKAQLSVPLFYSAANQELSLKRDLIALTPEFFSHPEPLLDEVERLEKAAIASADLVVAIASNMEPFLRSLGAQQIVVAGNGSRVALSTRHQAAGSAAASNEILFGCFGSSYWPNREGLASIIRPSLAFLPPNARLVTTGRLGFAIKDHKSYRRGRFINDNRLVHYDHLRADAYDALVQSCDILLLPVFVGSGSPLKTADALASGRPVLLTTKMLIGYEDIVAQNSDGVMVADTPAEFRAKWQELARLGKDAFADLVGRGASRREFLTWNSRLAPLLKALTGGGHA